MSHIWGAKRHGKAKQGGGNITAIKSKQEASSALTTHGEKLSVLKLMSTLSHVFFGSAAAREWASHLGKRGSPGRAGMSSADLLMGASSSMLALLPLACPFSKLCFPAAQDFINQAGFHKSS